MRIPFCSLTFATLAAERLSTLLPALPLDQAKEWTALVYGYSGWDNLESEVAKVDVPVLRNLEPAAKFAVDAYQAGRSGNDSNGRTEFQLQKLDELLGWNRRAAEKLYVTWEPRVAHPIQVDRLADLGPGSPAFQLMQTNIMEPFDSDGGVPAVAGFEGGAGIVYLGFPGTADERQFAISGLLENRPEHVPAASLEAITTALSRELQESPSVQPYGDDGTFAQVHRMTFFACRESVGRKLIGAGAATFAFIASRDGSHSVKVSVEHVVLHPNGELPYVMSEAIAVAVWEAIVRYLWCTVGDSGSPALVVVEYPAGDLTTTQCAIDAWEQIIDCSVGRLDNVEAVFQNIRFELVAKPQIGFEAGQLA